MRMAQRIAPAIEQRLIADQELAQIFQTQQMLARSMEPVIRQQQTIAQLMTPVIQQRQILNHSLAPVFETAAQMIQSPIVQLAASAVRLANTYSKAIQQAYTVPFLNWLHTVAFSPVRDYLSQIESILAELPDEEPFDKDAFEKVYLKEIYDARWFPYVGWNADMTLAAEVCKILETTRKSKNRVKRIDKAVFDYYSKSRIEEMKKDWRKLDMPEYLMRILHQAVQAYHRKEYAITATVLATTWEGIIYEKAHDSRRKKGKVTKENLGKLVAGEEYGEFIQKFFDECIMYECSSPAEAKEDVPGRNSLAHCMYQGYPKRKAGLNAILFTDFLVRVGEVEEEM